MTLAYIVALVKTLLRNTIETFDETRELRRTLSRRYPSGED
jgi:hypothetical protein